MENRTAFETNDTDHRVETRLPYQAPRLQVYGAVRDLTAGGSVGAAEGMMMTDMMRHV